MTDLLPCKDLRAQCRAAGAANMFPKHSRPEKHRAELVPLSSKCRASSSSMTIVQTYQIAPGYTRSSILQVKLELRGVALMRSDYSPVQRPAIKDIESGTHALAVAAHGPAEEEQCSNLITDQDLCNSADL